MAPRQTYGRGVPDRPASCGKLLAVLDVDGRAGRLALRELVASHAPFDAWWGAQRLRRLARLHHPYRPDAASRSRMQTHPDNHAHFCDGWLHS
jgi:hypothetical protein